MNATDGLYFRRDDYAGFWLRLLIDAIDLLVVGACCLVTVAVWTLFLPSFTLGLRLPACTVFVVCYFVPLKRSKIRTVGYRIGRVRIVGLDGQPASYLSLATRLLFGALGPLNWLSDLIWLSGDRHRQAIRDKFAQTYVIKTQAEPAGRGKLLYHYYEIFGYNFLFREVETKKAVAARPRPLPTR